MTTTDLAAIDAALDRNPCLLPAGHRGWFDDDLNRFISARSIAQHWDALEGITVSGRVADALTRRGPWWQ